MYVLLNLFFWLVKETNKTIILGGCQGNKKKQKKHGKTRVTGWQNI